MEMTTVAHCDTRVVTLLALLLLALLIGANQAAFAIEHDTEKDIDGVIPLYASSSAPDNSEGDNDKSSADNGMWVLKQEFVINPEQDKDTILEDSKWVAIRGSAPTEEEIAQQATEIPGFSYVGFEIVGDVEPLVILSYVSIDAPEEEKRIAQELTATLNSMNKGVNGAPTIEYYDIAIPDEIGTPLEDRNFEREYDAEVISGYSEDETGTPYSRPVASSSCSPGGLPGLGASGSGESAETYLADERVVISSGAQLGQTYNQSNSVGIVVWVFMLGLVLSALLICLRTPPK